MSPTLHSIFFSPTGTSKKIAEAVARGYGDEAAEIIDLTHRTAGSVTFPADTFVVFTVPVYGGRVAPTALERLKELRGTQTPAAIVVVYGNRDIGGAAAQFSAILSDRGFCITAAAAFVGEHSYSSGRYPIAVGRPDEDDLAAAEAFGGKLRRKLTEQAVAKIDVSRLRAPRTPLLSLLHFVWFVAGYRRSQKKAPVKLLPITDAAVCNHCGLCVTRCPVGAITEGREQETDAAACIRCCACVKGCPRKARTYDTPFAPVLARDFDRAKAPVTLL